MAENLLEDAEDLRHVRELIFPQENDPKDTTTYISLKGHDYKPLPF